MARQLSCSGLLSRCLSPKRNKIAIIWIIFQRDENGSSVPVETANAVTFCHVFPTKIDMDARVFQPLTVLYLTLWSPKSDRHEIRHGGQLQTDYFLLLFFFVESSEVVLKSALLSHLPRVALVLPFHAHHHHHYDPIHTAIIPHKISSHISSHAGSHTPNGSNSLVVMRWK